MRADLRHESPVTRHAIRVTAVAAAGYLLGTWLPFGHGYWAPMASVMVMRPDFSQTYSRAVARFGGTLVGVALATGLVQVAHPDTGLSAILAVLSAGMMYLLMRTGQMAAQACVAAYVVFLLGMGGEQWTQTVPERVILTLLGGVLAMIAYAVYPAWETPRLRTRLADWLIADGRYAAAVVGHYADPAGKSCPDVREALLAARDARIAWQEASDRAKIEPVRHRGLSRAAATDAEEALAQLGRVAMLMEAHLPERGATPCPRRAAWPRPCASRPSRARRRCANAAYRSGRRSAPPWRSGTAKACPTGSCAAARASSSPPWRSSPTPWTRARPRCCWTAPTHRKRPTGGRTPKALPPADGRTKNQDVPENPQVPEIPEAPENPQVPENPDEPEIRTAESPPSAARPAASRPRSS